MKPADLKIVLIKVTDSQVFLTANPATSDGPSVSQRAIDNTSGASRSLISTQGESSVEGGSASGTILNVQNR